MHAVKKFRRKSIRRCAPKTQRYTSLYVRIYNLYFNQICIRLKRLDIAHSLTNQQTKVCVHWHDHVAAVIFLPLQNSTLKIAYEMRIAGISPLSTVVTLDYCNFQSSQFMWKSAPKLQTR